MGANSSVPAIYDAPAYAILGLHVVLTTAAVLGRIVSRKWMKALPETDDYLAYAAYFANLGLLASGMLQTRNGALDLEAVNHQTDEAKQIDRDTWISLATFYALAITLVKCSILFLYRRTFTMLTTWFRYAWWFILVLTLLWTLTCSILIALQAAVVPIGGFSRLGISITGIVSAFTDFLLLGLPVFMISRMKLRKKQKISLISIFLVGAIASVVSIIRGTIFFITRASSLNKAYHNYLDIVFTATEASAGLICACLPLMRPIVIRATRWIGGIRGWDTERQGWTTMSGSGPKDAPRKPGEINHTNPRADDWDIQLLPVTPPVERLGDEVEEAEHRLSSKIGG